MIKAVSVLCEEERENDTKFARNPLVRGVSVRSTANLVSTDDQLHEKKASSRLSHQHQHRRSVDRPAPTLAIEQKKGDEGRGGGK